jgi:hypothetical protein
VKQQPAAHIAWDFEGRARAWVVAADDAEAERLWAWLRGRPEYGLLCDLLDLLREDEHDAPPELDDGWLA